MSTITRRTLTVGTLAAAFAAATGCAKSDSASSSEPMTLNVDGESTELREASYSASPRDLLIHLPRLPGHRRSVEREVPFEVSG